MSARARVAGVLDDYVGELQRNGLAIPRELSAFQCWFNDRNRQDQPKFAGDKPANKDEHMGISAVLDTDDVADHLKVSKRKAERLIASREISSFTVGRQRRVLAEDLQAYLMSRRTEES